MALAYQVLTSARTYLNDDDATLWPDARLLPKLQEAHRELALRLLLNGVPVTNALTAVLTVPANTVDGQNVDMSTVSGYPTDIVEPIWLKERTVGQTNQDFVDMTEVDFLPNLQKSTELVWWTWFQEKIFLLGALNDVQVQLRYRRGLTTPITVNDPIGVLYGELFLSRRTAAIAVESTGKDAARALNLTQEANNHFDTIRRAAIKEMQNLPARQRPYHRGRGRSRVLRDF